MKKIIILGVICLALLVGCAPKDDDSSVSVEGMPVDSSLIYVRDLLLGIPHNIGETFQVGYKSYEITENHIKVVTERVVCEATITPEIYAKLNKIDIFAEDKDTQYADVLKEWPINVNTLRSDFELTDEQMANLISKKGKNLIALGYTKVGYSQNENNSIFFMENNGYMYKVIVEEHVEDSNYFDAMKTFANCTIKSITSITPID